MRHLCFVFIILMFSCRTSPSFEGGRQSLTPVLEEGEGRHCIRHDKGWVWVDDRCRFIPAHFISSVTAYLRVLLEVNAQLSRYQHILGTDMSTLLGNASNAAYEASSSEGEIPYGSWLRSRMEAWKQSRVPNVNVASQNAQVVSYDWLMEKERPVIVILSESLANGFFKIMQAEHTKILTFSEQSLRESLTQSETRAADAFSLWNTEVNDDVERRKVNYQALTELRRHITEGQVN